MLMEKILARLDERLPLAALRELAEAEHARLPPLRVTKTGQVALVGHRAAGKSRILGFLSAWCGRKAVDLDRHIETVHGRNLRDWFNEDPASFRKAERETFLALPPGQVVSCGGGFLSLHADLLGPPHVAVQIPVSFETYVERLSRDRNRPRLRPELPLEDELRQVWDEREALHATSPAVGLVSFLLRTLDVGRSFA